MQGTSLKHEREALHYERYLPLPFPPPWVILGCETEGAIYRTALKTTEIIPGRRVFRATNLHDVANDDAVDDLRGDLAGSQGSPSGMFCQIGGREVLQQAPVGPERRSLRRNDEDTCNRSEKDPDLQIREHSGSLIFAYVS